LLFCKLWFKIRLTHKRAMLFWLHVDSLILILSAKFMSGVCMHLFTAQIYMELCLKWFYLNNSTFTLTTCISQNGYQIQFVTPSNGWWWHDPTPLKSPVQTLNCCTQLAHSILIRLKQALLLQNTEIWTVFNLFKVI